MNDSVDFVSDFKMSWDHLIRFIQHVDGSNIANALQSALERARIGQHEINNGAIARVLSTVQSMMSMSSRKQEYLHRLLRKGIQFSYFAQCKFN